MSTADAHPFLDWPHPIPFAHRGGASEAPENTMAAFEHAIRLGYTYLETDVHTTSDGVLVAFHDDDLLRTCGRKGRIAQLPWSIVSTARVAGTAPIPLLDEILGTWPAARVNIDCKADRSVDALVAALRRCVAFDRVCVAAFDDRRLSRLRRLAGPQLCTSLGTASVALLRLMSLAARQTASRPTGRVAAQVPVRHGRVEIITRQFVRFARSRGVPVHAWTIDDPAEMARLLDLGVDGIMTDRPALLRGLLVDRGQWIDP